MTRPGRFETLEPLPRGACESGGKSLDRVATGSAVCSRLVLNGTVAIIGAVGDISAMRYRSERPVTAD